MGCCLRPLIFQDESVPTAINSVLLQQVKPLLMVNFNCMRLGCIINDATKSGPVIEMIAL